MLNAYMVWLNFLSQIKSTAHVMQMLLYTIVCKPVDEGTVTTPYK